MRRGKTTPDPRCWWCHERTDPATPYRGQAPELSLPRGSGVFVCTPACPSRPDGLKVWKVGQRTEAMA